MAEKSVAKTVREYIEIHPSIMDCMKKKLVNLSALSREIMADKGLQNEYAVLAACRRYENSSAGTNEKAIMELLGKSNVVIKSKMAVITAKNDWNVFLRLKDAMSAMPFNAMPNIIMGSNGMTIITDDERAREIVKTLGKASIIDSRRDLVEITVASPNPITDVPGILAYLSSSLASVGVNIVEAASCHTDTIFVLERKDMTRGFEVLSNCLSSGEKTAGANF